ncbi:MULTISPECIES: DUF4179 domain-containing protein [Desulfitobacterium]|uniref:DUF4179 domain-containing protein n=1 Tax=Desulfitobacterium dehalogenans (strain ATCC 51507 / DSM 9161 / JW/IU-DC1) TaxID=756499 RepID=I4A7X7_DESDJ|nr:MULTISPECIES: DUF4179 domain-containing protein [Desulfitobacterium]AFM00062.1 hypothetical protein Desde_1659 [Desulfitobacterium dehalogenans ATCC 51507]
MKDLYEFFNEIDIDLNEFEEAEVDELEKSRVKKRVRERIAETGHSGGLKKRRKSKGMVAVAAAMIMTVGLSGFGLAFPAYAKEVPVIGDIFRFLDDGRTGVYDLYTEKALDIDMVKADNGIEVTLNQGVYDGKTLSFTYTIKTEKDFGERPYLNSEVDVDFAQGSTGGEQLKRVSPGVYVGQSNYTFFSEEEARDSISFRWKISGMTNMEEGAEPKENKKTPCKLNFSVSLNTLDYTVVKIDANQDQVQNVAISLNRLSITPINTLLYYSEIVPNTLSHAAQMDWEIKDDLGNVYEYEGNGGHGKVGDKMTEMEHIITFKRLDPKAKTLLITPTLKLVPTQGGGVEFDENGHETRFSYEGLPEGVTAGEWTMKPISVDLSAVN